MRIIITGSWAVLGFVLSVTASPALAVDLPTLSLAAIDPPALRARHARQPERFAESVPVDLSLQTGLLERGLRSAWSYRISAPRAVAVGFHADRLELPSGAKLFVNGVEQPVSVQEARNYWSTPVAGSSIVVRIESSLGAPNMHIDSVQTGFRDPSAANADTYPADCIPSVKFLLSSVRR
jgi:hypothetical protein